MPASPKCSLTSDRNGQGLQLCRSAADPIALPIVQVTTRGFVFPVVADIEAAIYCDTCPGATGCRAWRFPDGHGITYGLDLGPVRLRLALDRLNGRKTLGWGLI